MSTDSWLILRDITLHSGQHSNFKFECDNFTDGEIEGFAFLIRQMRWFSEVQGIPTGGIRLAQALEPFVERYYRKHLLIVDDVLTQGTSMECARVDAIRQGWCIKDISGAVMIARGQCPSWIAPILQLHPRLCV